MEFVLNLSFVVDNNNMKPYSYYSMFYRGHSDFLYSISFYEGVEVVFL